MVISYQTVLTRLRPIHPSANVQDMIHIIPIALVALPARFHRLVRQQTQIWSCIIQTGPGLALSFEAIEGAYGLVTIACVLPFSAVPANGNAFGSSFVNADNIAPYQIRCHYMHKRGVKSLSNPHSFLL